MSLTGIDYGRAMQAMRKAPIETPLYKPKPSIWRDIIKALTSMIDAVETARHEWALARRRHVSELTPDEVLIFAALKAGKEGGKTVQHVVSVQDRRA